ncbi:MAG TPA: hypothetical protein EYP43_02675 [Thermoplasmata archaeon]|nr:hypothetical protein [Thermoplasmata archaeon]
MGGIRDILLRRMPEEELEARVRGVRREFGDLIDDEAALYIIAIDRGDMRGRLMPISDLRDGMWACLTGHVTSTGWSRTGHVVSWLTLEDGTGRVRCVLWRKELADMVRSGDIMAGDRVLVLNGRIRSEGAPEVHVDARGSIEVLPEELAEVGTVREGDVVNLRGVVSSVTPAREFTRRDGTTGQVASITLFDGTGELRIVLWDDAVRHLGGVEVGDDVSLMGVVVRSEGGRLEAHSVRGTKVRVLRPA